MIAGDPLVERMQVFGTTVFAEMSALAIATDSINLGQGFPDTDGPPELLEAAAAAITGGGANQYPPGIGGAGAAAGDRRAPAAVLRPRVRPGLRGARHGRRDRGHRGRAARPRRPRRRGGRFRALLRLLRRVDRSRRRAPRGSSRFAGTGRAGRSTPTDLEPRDQPPHEGDPAQLAAQPDRQGVQPRRTRADRRRRDRATISSSSPTRSTSTWSSTASTSRSPPCPACASGRSRCRVPGKTFSVTGWKIGWVCAPPALLAAVRGGQAVPHLRERWSVPARRSARPWRCPIITSTRPTRSSSASATCCAPGWPTSAWTSSSPRRPTSPPSSCPATRASSAAAFRSSTGSWPSRVAFSTTRPSVTDTCGSRSASDQRCSTKQCAGSRE